MPPRLPKIRYIALSLSREIGGGYIMTYKKLVRMGTIIRCNLLGKIGNIYIYLIARVGY